MAAVVAVAVAHVVVVYARAMAAAAPMAPRRRASPTSTTEDEPLQLGFGRDSDGARITLHIATAYLVSNWLIPVYFKTNSFLHY